MSSWLALQWLTKVEADQGNYSAALVVSQAVIFEFLQMLCMNASLTRHVLYERLFHFYLPFRYLLDSHSSSP